MRTYATPDDLSPDWLDTPPDNAPRLIRAASLLVSNATRLARYATDDDGYPTQPAHKAAFTNAVCQQVAIWANANLDPDKGLAGQDPHLTGQSAGSGSINYSGAQTTQELGAAATTLAEPVKLILDEAGLLNPHITVI